MVLRTGSVEWSRGFPGAGLPNLGSVGHYSTRLVGLATFRDYLLPPPPPRIQSNVCLPMGAVRLPGPLAYYRCD